MSEPVAPVAGAGDDGSSADAPTGWTGFERVAAEPAGAGYGGDPYTGGTVNGYWSDGQAAQQGYEQQGSEQQGYAQPTYAQPTFAQPTFAQPTFAQPTFAQPTFAQPQPVYREAAATRTPRRAGLIAAGIAIAVVAGALGAVGGTAATLAIADRPSTSTTTTPPGGFSSPQDAVTVAAAVLPSAVQIRVVSGTSGDTGSGFVLTAEGMIATNNHVVADAATGAQITVSFSDGSKSPAHLIGRSPSYDLAVIKVDDHPNLKPVVTGDSDALRIGDPVMAIGSPLGLSGTVTTGIISSKNRPVTTGGNGDNSYISALQTDAAINPGNSGGPLVDMTGKVVGVNSAIATLGSAQGGQSGSIGLGFSIPINTVKRVTDQIIATGHAVYPVIGANVDMTYTGDGARITAVESGSPAEKAGLQSGDIVTSFDGQPVASGVELIVETRNHAPGQKVRMVVSRSGNTSDLTVTLGSKQG